MILNVNTTVEKIKDDGLPFWKLFTVDKYNRDKVRAYGSFNEKELEKSIDMLQKQIDAATEFEDCIFKIEARPSNTANGDSIKEWYFKADGRGNSKRANNNNSDFGGLGLLERPFVQNILNGIEEDKRYIQQQKDSLFHERFTVNLEKAMLERDKADFDKEKAAWEAEKKELQAKLTNRTEMGLNTIGIAVENLLSAGAKNPDALNGVISAIIRGEDINLGKLGGASAKETEATPEEKAIEAIATYIYDSGLPVPAIEEVKKIVIPLVDKLKQHNQ
jgi:hypothetical protein